jgi:adenosylcobyric acid synthase
MSAALMLMGTGSDVGKSVLVAGLCRLFTRRGLRVLPFKPQNMSNNAAVTPDGLEIGRAQALQARACRAELSVDMNPVLLKPQTDIGAQVVVRGEVRGNVTASEFQTLKGHLPGIVRESYLRLRGRADLVIVEGAGSPAEVNLRANDIANMGFALGSHVPVVMVGDIDRGGVIASLVGTHALLPRSERDLIKGFIINKFRGDPALFDEGRRIITARTGWYDFGLVPWLSAAARLPAEDAVALEQTTPPGEGSVDIAVPMLSRIANFDDLDPLRAEPAVNVRMVPPGQAIPPCDLVVIPGTKATLAELAFFRTQGWHIDLAAHARRGGRVLGLCGGYQMLGLSVSDPEGIEGPVDTVPGLGLLDVATTIGSAKTLGEVHGTHLVSGAAVRGYEMHMGRSTGPAIQRSLFALRRPGSAATGNVDQEAEGAQSADGRIAGTYVHGVFAADEFRAWFLAQLGVRSAVTGFDGQVDEALDDIAQALEDCLDVERLLQTVE